MITPRELISVCRQIGGMMEAGVDILRITRVLRSQTENPRLLDLYDSIDHELTMGRGLADVMARASDVFSPFAISLVRQGEERNDLAGAFLRLSDFLEKEVDLQNGAARHPKSASSLRSKTASPPFAAIDSCSEDVDDSRPFEVLWLRSVWLLSAWLMAAGLLLVASEIADLNLRWRLPLCLVACALIGGVAAWRWNRTILSNDELSNAGPASFESTAGTNDSAVSIADWSDQHEHGQDAPPLSQSTLRPGRNNTNATASAPEQATSDDEPADATTVLDRFKQPSRRVLSEEEFD